MFFKIFYGGNEHIKSEIHNNEDNNEDYENIIINEIRSIVSDENFKNKFKSSTDFEGIIKSIEEKKKLSEIFFFIAKFQFNYLNSFQQQLVKKIFNRLNNDELKQFLSNKIIDLYKESVTTRDTYIKQYNEEKLKEILNRLSNNESSYFINNKKYEMDKRLNNKNEMDKTLNNNNIFVEIIKNNENVGYEFLEKYFYNFRFDNFQNILEMYSEYMIHNNIDFKDINIINEINKIENLLEYSNLKYDLRKIQFVDNKLFEGYFKKDIPYIPVKGKLIFTNDYNRIFKIYTGEVNYGYEENREGKVLFDINIYEVINKLLLIETKEIIDQFIKKRPKNSNNDSLLKIKDNFEKNYKDFKLFKISMQLSKYVPYIELLEEIKKNKTIENLEVTENILINNTENILDQVQKKNYQYQVINDRLGDEVLKKFQNKIKFFHGKFQNEIPIYGFVKFNFGGFYIGNVNETYLPNGKGLLYMNDKNNEIKFIESEWYNGNLKVNNKKIAKVYIKFNNNDSYNGLLGVRVNNYLNNLEILIDRNARRRIKPSSEDVEKYGNFDNEKLNGVGLEINDSRNIINYGTFENELMINGISIHEINDKFLISYLSENARHININEINDKNNYESKYKNFENLDNNSEEIKIIINSPKNILYVERNLIQNEKLNDEMNIFYNTKIGFENYFFEGDVIFINSLDREIYYESFYILSGKLEILENVNDIKSITIPKSKSLFERFSNIGKEVLTHKVDSDDDITESTQKLKSTQPKSDNLRFDYDNVNIRKDPTQRVKSSESKSDNSLLDDDNVTTEKGLINKENLTDEVESNQFKSLIYEVSGYVEYNNNKIEKRTISIDINSSKIKMTIIPSKNDNNVIEIEL
jgi:hypothetical protein